ncbi:AarF/UbiB family protein [uncultured Fluviicola sp.]|uniref:ABC1 kinase family protein n=1 Tax=uncultured Fluviicola sp. TaxID=463303 RepID=UPI0025F3DA8A|nr:AarF/UbiB family protein [uncultured Fluviicola sp.]
MALFENIRQRYRSFRRFNHILRIFVRYGYEDVVSYLIETRRFSLLRKLIPRSTARNARKYTKYEKMRLVCEDLGPTFIKFGQILSNRSDLLPADLIIQLEKLQDNVPPQSGAISRQVIESELKKPMEELFAWYETEAFASASMAQVHKATLKTGEKVAVKVQRPEIQAIIVEDIKIMYMLARIFERRIPSLRSFDPLGLVQNFEESILKELDFIRESVSIQRFARNILDDPNDNTTHVPKVYKEYTTGKVLTMEFISGVKVTDNKILESNGYDRKEVAHKLAVTYIKQVFQYGFFHADPHPGNILVLPNGHICFLDFGMMGTILPRDIEILGHLFLAVKSKDVRKIIRTLMRMSDMTTIRDMRSLEYEINEFVANYSVISIHQNEMSTVLLQLKDIIVRYDLKVPAHFFLLARSMVTIEGLISNLDPKIDMLEIARPYLRSAISKKLNPFTLGMKVLNGLYEMANYMEEFPNDLKNAVRKINSGKINVNLNHQGIDPLVHTFNRVTKQLAASLVIAALLVGSALFIIHKVGPFWFGYSRYGVIGIIFSFILGYGMIKNIFKGDHDDWSGWKEK